jgi:hypothetical protein
MAMQFLGRIMIWSGTNMMGWFLSTRRMSQSPFHSRIHPGTLYAGYLRMEASRSISLQARHPGLE